MEPYKIIDRGRGPELSGTRVNVYQIVPYLEAGRTVDEIAEWVNVPAAAVQLLIDYFHEYREEVMVVHRKIEERNARGTPPEILKRLEGSPTHALIQARLAEIRRKLAEEEKNGEGNSGR